jgi:acetolactate synthase-1/2/3 large subunit
MDARSTSNTQTHSAAYFLLEGLNEIGVDYLFCNFGTDHAPIIEELANRKQRGEPVPKTIRCAHENTAAHMAAGYALMTGRGQGVLVHVDVGTANTATAMHNLFRSRLPVLLMAGKAPFTAAHELTGTRDTYVHFVQEPFDQGSLVRPYVKWEWTLPSGVVVKEALRRAHTIMQSEPRGPVYLMMARETLAQEWDEADMRRYSAEQFGGAAQGAADPELIAQLAARIEAAQNPMLITAYAGRNPDASRAIEELAEFAGIAVYESNFVNNISHEGPCFLGFVPDKHLPEADLGLLVDIDVPWFPRDVQQKEGSYWAQIDVDVLKTASPMWTFPSNLRLQGDSARILTQLLARLKEIATPKFREAAAARVKSFESVRTARIERAKQLASDKGKPDEINPHYLFAELAKLIEPTDIVFNEAVRNSGALALQIPRPLPGTMALGAKLAAPDRMMVQVVGDGSFYFNCPSSVFAAAKQYKLPFLSIVLDNTGWSAVKESTLRVFPDGKAKATKEFEAELSPDVDFAKVGEAFGAHGEKVRDPAEVPAALKRCVDAVRGGRAALLHARVTRI